jgi:hypothetical protein
VKFYKELIINDNALKNFLFKIYIPTFAVPKAGKKEINYLMAK